MAAAEAAVVVLEAAMAARAAGEEAPQDLGVTEALALGAVEVIPQIGALLAALAAAEAELTQKQAALEVLVVGVVGVPLLVLVALAALAA